jgi:hypothetical protein
MRLDNRAVYARGEAEVVRIDDQPSQAASLAGGEREASRRHRIPLDLKYLRMNSLSLNRDCRQTQVMCLDDQQSGLINQQSLSG